MSPNWPIFVHPVFSGQPAPSPGRILLPVEELSARKILMPCNSAGALTISLPACTIRMCHLPGSRSAVERSAWWLLIRFASAVLARAPSPRSSFNDAFNALKAAVLLGLIFELILHFVLFLCCWLRCANLILSWSATPRWRYSGVLNAS